MARMIKYRTQCIYCKVWFEKGQAFLQRIGQKWACQCKPCFRKQKYEKSEEQLRENIAILSRKSREMSYEEEYKLFQEEMNKAMENFIMPNQKIRT